MAFGVISLSVIFEPMRLDEFFRESMEREEQDIKKKEE